MNWTGKRALVTGAGGFIGSHLAERLVELGADVRALVRYNGRNSSGWLDDSPYRDHMEVVLGDVTDPASVHSSMAGREIVFHLAALIAIPYSYRAAASYVRTNIEGTLNVVEAARRIGTERLIHTSSSEVYGTARAVPMDEHHALQAQSPYAASKIGADKLIEAFHLSFDVPVTTVRPFNTFGPRQSQRAVVPSIIAQCLAGGASLRLGNLHPTRDFTYVSDTVEGFVRAAAAPDAIGATFNLGCGEHIGILELARLIAAMTGAAVEIGTDAERVRPATSEVERLVADSSKARTLLGWHPRIDLAEGLHRTIDWMRGHLREFRVEQHVV